MRTPHGPASMGVTVHDGAVEARAWGPGAEWILHTLPDLLGERDDPRGFRPTHPVLREMHRSRPGLRLTRSNAVVDALIPTIIEQKVTSQDARSSYLRLLNALGEPAPGPLGLTLPPAPELLASLPYYKLHRFGIERRRAQILGHACSYASRLEETLAMTKEEATRRLRALPGVGPWTVGHVTRLAYGDPDAVIVGDFHIPHMATWTLAGEPRGSDERMLELLEPYRGHRGRALRLIEIGGRHPPSYHIKRPVRSIERI
jgi:3-methyladenine DNA glycosylase/8-oxoguanine DNA glycosylase